MSNFELAQSCINAIDDHLEYAYKSHLLPQDLRDRILGIIDDYTEACVAHTRAQCGADCQGACGSKCYLESDTNV